MGIHVRVFQDDNANGIKEGNEAWANNIAVDIFHLSDDPATTPLYNGSTNASGAISFLDIRFCVPRVSCCCSYPKWKYNFVSGVGDVTTDSNGYQGVVFNTSNQIVDVTSAFSSKTMSIQGNYWQDYEAVPNGIKDAHDLLSNTVGRTVRLFNVTDDVYESVSATIQVDKQVEPLWYQMDIAYWEVKRQVKIQRLIIRQRVKILSS